MHTLVHHIRVYGVFCKNSLIKQMTYRGNFLMMMMIESMFLVWKLLYTFVISGTGISLNGIDANAMFLFSGSFIMMTGIYVALFFFNFTNIQQLVGDGTLDLYLTKPVSLQFMVTLRTIDLGTAVPNLIGGLAILTVGWRKSDIPVDFYHVGGYVLFLILAIMTSYSVMLAPQLMSFVLIRGSALREISDAVWDSNSMPMTIYGKAMQLAGIYILPLFVISNYSSLFILGKLTPWDMIWAFLTPFICFILVRLLWNKMLTYYASASS